MDLRSSTAVQALTERLKAEPVTFQRMGRPDIFSTVTSGSAGEAIPLGFIPLLREDALETTRLSLRCYMEETVELLLNSVNCVFSAYAVPKMAFDRFGGSMDALNRSYMGQAEMDGSFIPWIDDHTLAGADTEVRPIYKAAGLHGPDGARVNLDYVEAYNKVFEFRCRQRSEALWDDVEPTLNNPGQLRPAFFDNPQMSIAKPTFDSQMLDGDVPLTVVSADMPVRGIGVKENSYTTPAGVDRRETGGINRNGAAWQETAPGDSTANPGDMIVTVAQDPANLGFPGVFAELAENGITVSTSNLELAKQTQAWARVRAQYSGLDDDQLVDLLMSGVRVPDVHLTKPILLGRSKVPFGMTQRYSTESANLDVSATRGVAGTDMTIRCPQMNTGAVVVIIAEVVPDQFWERSADYHFLAAEDTKRPDRLLDQIDPQAVSLLTNIHGDVKHTDPLGIFGYAPLNHEYVRRRFNVGGKFYKENPTDPWNQDRNRIWASEPIDPTLSRSMYLAEDLPEEIFMTTNQDNFEFSCACQATISGLTFVGPALREQTNDYESIMERVDHTRLVGDGEEIPGVTSTSTDDETPVEYVPQPANGDDENAS